MEIMCGLSAELSLMISVACRGPVCAGVNVTFTVVLAPGATLIGRGEAL